MAIRIARQETPIVDRRKKLEELRAEMAETARHTALPQRDLPAHDEQPRKRVAEKPKSPSPKSKVKVSIYLDREVIDHFKAQGRFWQTRINDILKEHIRRT